MWRGISHIFCIKFFNIQLFLGFLFSLLEIPLLWDPYKTCIYIFKWLLLCDSDASQSRKKAAHLSCMWNAVSFRRKCSIGRGVISVLPVEYKSSKDDIKRWQSQAMSPIYTAHYCRRQLDLWMSVIVVLPWVCVLCLKLSGCLPWVCECSLMTSCATILNVQYCHPQYQSKPLTFLTQSTS